jgi:hypothetical protein
MPFCTTCGREVSPTDRYCRWYGHPQFQFGMPAGDPLPVHGTGVTREPGIEDISSEKVHHREITALQTLETRISWARTVTHVGAITCSFWLIYRVFEAQGFWGAVFAFIGLCVVYGFGLSPMFAVAASVLCFHFTVVGM